MALSKPVARIALAVLIALAVIAATSAAVQGLLGRTASEAQENVAKAHEVSGLQTNLNHYRSSIYGQDYFGTQAEPYIQPQSAPDKGGHNCESEMRVDPND
jgi:hypothetical protein